MAHGAQVKISLNFAHVIACKPTVLASFPLTRSACRSPASTSFRITTETLHLMNRSLKASTRSYKRTFNGARADCAYISFRIFFGVIILSPYLKI
jgi:hypothetical protein